MAQVVIRNIDDDVVEHLKAGAAERKPLEQKLGDVLIKQPSPRAHPRHRLERSRSGLGWFRRGGTMSGRWIIKRLAANRRNAGRERA